MTRWLVLAVQAGWRAFQGESLRLRALAQQLLTCWAALTVGPVALAGSVSLGGMAREWIGDSAGGRALIRAAITLVTCAVFTLLYLITPKTRVRLRAAAVGGFAAGLAW